MTAQPQARTESFPCDGPADVDIRIRGGDIAVRATDAPCIRVELSPAKQALSLDDAELRMLSETEVTFTEQGRKLVIRRPRSLRHGGIDVVVDVPRHSMLNASAHRGSISTSGTLSGLEAATGGGPIAVDEVEGPVKVTTGSGEITLGRVAGALRARLGSGDFEAASIEGDGATVATGDGAIRLGVVQCDAKVRTGRGAIVVNEAASGRISLATGSGDVRVGIRPGVAAELDVASGSGQVRSELEVTHGAPAGTPPARIRVRTGSGEAVVASAAA
jgi:DUF4097 and DUF4098 domain-containing protein YvlB